MKRQHQTSSLTIFESALFRTTSTVIKTADLIIVIDPNWLPQEVATIKKYVTENRDGLPVYLFFTHSDYDHIIGHQVFPEAQVIVSENLQNNPKSKEIIEQILTFDDEYYIERSYDIRYPKGDFIIKTNGERLQLGKTDLQFFEATGHNSDGLLLWIAELGILVVGDYLCNVEFPYIYHSGKAYLETLDRIEGIIDTENVKYLITGHGDFTSDIAEMKKRITDARRYIFSVIKAIKSGQDFDITVLWEVYKFPRIMTKFHQGNVKVLKKEFC